MGDEFATVVRWWTHGYNIYHPTMGYIFHLTLKARWSGQGSHRKWHDKPREDGPSFRGRELARMEQLFGLEDHGIDLGPYGLGTERTLAGYEAFSGVSLRNRTFRNFSHMGPFGKEHSPEEDGLFDWWKHGLEQNLPVTARESVETVLPSKLLDGIKKSCDADGMLVADVIDRRIESYVKSLSKEAGGVARFGLALAGQRERASGSKYLEWLAGTVEPDLKSFILLEIPAYDDPELQKTIKSALAMAAAPDRIHFAICLQGGTEADEAFLDGTPHCRYVTYKAEDAPGSCAARADCQDMLDGEDFVLRLDGHMRFAWGWDVSLLRQWRECDDPKAILTEHPMDYSKMFDEAPDSDLFTERASFGANVLNVDFFRDMSCVFRTRSLCFVKDAVKPVRGMLVAGGMCFQPASANGDVPFDRNMHFVADECSMSVRYYSMYEPSDVDFSNPVIMFMNEAGWALPSTGGPGATCIYIAGAAVTVIAVIGFCWNRRNRRNSV